MMQGNGENAYWISDLKLSFPCLFCTCGASETLAIKQAKDPRKTTVK